MRIGTALLGQVSTTGLVQLSVSIYDAFGQRIVGWPDLTARAIPAPNFNFSILTGATNNNTYSDGATAFTLLRLNADVNATAHITATVSSPSLPDLSAQSALNPAPPATIEVVQCLLGPPDFQARRSAPLRHVPFFLPAPFPLFSPCPLFPFLSLPPFPFFSLPPFLFFLLAPFPHAHLHRPLTWHFSAELCLIL